MSSSTKRNQQLEALWVKLRKLRSSTRLWWYTQAVLLMKKGDVEFIFDSSDELYLVRFFVSGKPPLSTSSNSLLLHYFVKSDPDRHLHNHPHQFNSRVISGGYVEVTSENGVEARRTLKEGDNNIIGPDKYHRVVEVLPETWTLVHTGKRVQSWGFLVDGVHVPWKKYLNISDEE